MKYLMVSILLILLTNCASGSNHDVVSWGTKHCERNGGLVGIVYNNELHLCQYLCRDGTVYVDKF